MEYNSAMNVIHFNDALQIAFMKTDTYFCSEHFSVL